MDAALKIWIALGFVDIVLGQGGDSLLILLIGPGRIGFARENQLKVFFVLFFVHKVGG
jgi:hypothetical protein